MTQIYPRSYLCHLRHLHSVPANAQSFMVFTLPGITVRCTVPLHSISTFWYLASTTTFSVQSHYSPLAGVFLVSAIIAHRRQNLPVFGRNNDTFPQFQAPFHPHPKRQCIPDLFQPFQPFLFLFLQLFPLSYPARRPASSFRRSITVWKSSSPGRGVLQAIYRFSFPFST